MEWVEWLVVVVFFISAYDVYMERKRSARCTIEVWEDDSGEVFQIYGVFGKYPIRARRGSLDQLNDFLDCDVDDKVRALWAKETGGYRGKQEDRVEYRQW